MSAPAEEATTVDLHPELLDDLDSLQDDWRRLAEQAGNVFTTWEWASTWWKHFGRDRPLLLAAGRAPGGRLAAILPLHLATTAPLRIVRFIGYGPADQLGPVCSPPDQAASARLLRHALSQAPWRWDVFFAEELAAEEGWSLMLEGKVLKQTENPVLHFSGGWDELLAQLSSNAREQVRRRERKLTRGHELRYRLADDPDRLQDDLDTLFALHSAQWGISHFAAEEAFHREFARLAFERGWLRLWFMELDGAAVAAWLGFRFAGRESYYQAGRNPAFESSSVGFVLLCHSIREALSDGVQEYRFGRGGESYKYRFATDDPGLEMIGVSHGGVGALALAMAPLFRRRFPRWLQRWYHAYEAEPIAGGGGGSTAVRPPSAR
jgi:CelD/BcsL family acetyltransferase involved in cellulose biosynthesis